MQSFFVSSTFKDMQGERDALHHLVMPQMRELAREYGQDVEFIDLRWGISTKEMDSESGTAKIMEVCLDEIKRCNPYMIILLGERYGWMPDPSVMKHLLENQGEFSLDETISITELEIRYGMYLSTGALNHCVFCFRNPVPVDGMSDEMRAVYESGSETDAERMRRLKSKIRESASEQIIEYSLSWDAEQKELGGYEDFTDKLSERLSAMPKAEWGEPRKLTWQEKQKQEDALLYKHHVSSFVGRSAELQEYMQKIQTKKSTVIIGTGGSGKSAFLSKLYEANQNMSEIIYCGNSKECTTVKQLIQIICYRLGSYLNDGFASTEPSPKASLDIWKDYLDELAGKNWLGEITIYIDAIDQLMPQTALYESWYLPMKIGNGLHFVVTTTEAVSVNPRLVEETCFLLPPAEAELQIIARAHFAKAHKDVSENVLKQILQNPCSKNMLGLELMVQWLVSLNRKDFEEISKRELTMGGDAAIESYLCQFVKEMPQELESLILGFMDDVCKIVDEKNPMCVNLPLNLIAILRHGITREQIADFAEFVKSSPFCVEALPEGSVWLSWWNELQFSRLQRYLAPFFIQTTDGRIDLSHRLLKDALRERKGSGYIAYFLREYFDAKVPDDDLTKLKNMQILCRLAVKDGIQAEDLFWIKKYAENQIVRAQSEEEQLSAIADGVRMDVNGENGPEHMNFYCKMLANKIQMDETANAQSWLVWFYVTYLGKKLREESDTGKALELQLLCQYAKSMDSVYEKRVEKYTQEQLLRDLYYRMCGLCTYNELSVARAVSDNRDPFFDYGYAAKDFFQGGIKLAEQIMRQKFDKPLLYQLVGRLYIEMAYCLAFPSTVIVHFSREQQIDNYLEKGIQYTDRALENSAINAYLSNYSRYADTISQRIFHHSRFAQTSATRALSALNEAYKSCEKKITEKNILKETQFINSYCNLLLQSHLQKVSEQRDQQTVADLLYEQYQKVVKVTSQNADISLLKERSKLAASLAMMLMLAHPPAAMENKISRMQELGREIVEKELAFAQAYSRTGIEENYRYILLLTLESYSYKENDSKRAANAAKQVKIFVQEKKEKSEKTSNLFLIKSIAKIMTER